MESEFDKLNDAIITTEIRAIVNAEKAKQQEMIIRFFELVKKFLTNQDGDDDILLQAIQNNSVTIHNKLVIFKYLQECIKEFPGKKQQLLALLTNISEKE